MLTSQIANMFWPSLVFLHGDLSWLPHHPTWVLENCGIPGGTCEGVYACSHARTGLIAVPEIFIDNQRVEHVQLLRYLGQIFASDSKVKKEVSRRLALGYAAFNKLGIQGMWREKLVGGQS
jgi:hypothetical protein